MTERTTEPAGRRLPLTPSQTVGPFLAVGLSWEGGDLAAPVGAPGEIRIAGLLLDGAGEPVPDGLVETWQADPDGRFDHPDDPRGPVPRGPGASLFGRCLTGPDGRWAVTTLRPGPVTGPGGSVQAPHLDVSVFARGLLDRVVTRIYLPEDAELAGPGGHRADPVLAAVAPERRHTLIAVASGGEYRLDLRLQGPDETVFFAL